MRSRILTISLAVLLAPLVARPQALVLDLISPAGEPLEATRDISLQRFADFEPAPTVELGMQLDDGDLVSSVSGRTLIELECPPDSNSTFKLSGPFRVIITSAVEGNCRLDLLSGSLDVLTDVDTEVNSGGAVLGTEGTQYSMTVYRRDGNAIRDLQVYDGTVAVSGIEEPVRVGRREALTLSPQFSRPVKTPVDSRRLRRVSSLYGRFDAGKAVRLGADKGQLRELQSQFRHLHDQVLSDPDSANARAELAQTQVAYRLNNEAVYNLRRADLMNQQGFDTYRIDPGQIAEGLRPANYQLLQTRFPDRTFQYVPPAQLRAVDGLGAATISAPTTHSLRLVDQGEVKKLAVQLEDKVKAGNANSRDYRALAQAYVRLGDAKTGAAYAERALKLSQSDRLLSQKQIREVNALAKDPDG